MGCLVYYMLIQWIVFIRIQMPCISYAYSMDHFYPGTYGPSMFKSKIDISRAYSNPEDLVK